MRLIESGQKETLDWLYRLRSEIYVYMPKEWLIPMNNALDTAIKALEQEPKTSKEKDFTNGWSDTIYELWRKQEPKTGHWIYDKTVENWICSECGETPKTMGYCGSANFMAEHFKYCNHCGAKMSEWLLDDLVGGSDE